MASGSVLSQLRAIYPNLSEDMATKERDMYFRGIVAGFEARQYGNYEGRELDNLTFLEEMAPMSLLDVKRNSRAHQHFLKQYWPEIMAMQFRFRSGDDFVKYHLDFAKKYVCGGMGFYLAGSSEEPDYFGKHEGCEYAGEHLGGGCEMCELLWFLNFQIPAGHDLLEDRIRDFAQQGRNGAEFEQVMGGTNLTVAGTWKDGKVVRLRITGRLHCLAWELWRSKKLELEARLPDGGQHEKNAHKDAKQQQYTTSSDEAEDKYTDDQRTVTFGMTLDEALASLPRDYRSSQLRDCLKRAEVTFLASREDEDLDITTDVGSEGCCYGCQLVCVCA